MDEARDEPVGETGAGGRCWVIGLSVVLVATLVGLYWLWPAYRDFLNEAWGVLTGGDEARIREWVGGFGAWGPLMLVFLMVLQMFLIVAPSWLLMVIAVLAYGPVWGGLLSVVAVAVASAVGYAIGRVVGERGLYRLLGEKKEEAVRRETERYGTWAVVIARINPLFSNDAISFVGGMLGLGFWKFLVATVAGIAPLAIAIAVFGEEWTSMRTGLAWISAVSLVALGIKVWIDKRGPKHER